MFALVVAPINITAIICIVLVLLYQNLKYNA